MNEEFKEILERVQELTGTWDYLALPNRILLPALMHLERRVEANEKAIERTIENLGRVIGILENLHIVPRREE